MAEPGSTAGIPALNPGSSFNLIVAFVKEREDMLGHEPATWHSRKHSFV